MFTRIFSDLYGLRVYKESKFSVVFDQNEGEDFLE